MNPPKKGLRLGSLLGGLVSIETTADKPAAPAKPAPASSPAHVSPAVNPEVITSLLRTPMPVMPTASAPKQKPALAHDSRVPQLIEQIAGKIPTDNALMKLAVVEQQLDAAGIKDPTARRTAALGILSGTQNVSAKEISTAGEALKVVINDHFDGLQQQVANMNSTTIPQMRTESEGLRARADEARGQIEALEAQIATLTADADRLDREASDREEDLRDFSSEIEAARTAATAQFCGTT